MPAQVAGRLRRMGGVLRIVIGLSEQFKAARRIMRRLERQVVEDSKTLCLCVSDMIAKEYDTYYHRRDGVRVIYNSVNVPAVGAAERAGWREEKRAELGARDDDLVLICVAQDFARKGVGPTITAFAKWYHERAVYSGARLVLIGENASEHYRRLAREAGVAERVFFIGASNEIFKWYAASEGSILLTWYDPCSLVVLEAARWGIPSITTAYNGASSLVGEGGVVVSSPADVRAVSAGLDKLADPTQRAEMAQSCLAIADHLSMERYIDELLVVYAEAIEQ